MPSRSRASSLAHAIDTKSPTVSDTTQHLYDDQDLLRKLRTISIECRKVHTAPVEEEPKTDVARYSKYEGYLSSLNDRTTEYQVVIEQAQVIDQQLSLAIAKFGRVSTQTEAFASSTGQLFKSCTDLETLHASLNEYMGFFDALDPIVRVLHHSTSASTVKRDSFRSRLAKIDASLEFLEQHKDFKDAETYRIKFKQCLLRCCNMMASYLTSSLKTLYSEVAKSLEGVTQLGTQDALLYNKFKSRAADFYSVSEELSNRCLSTGSGRYHDDVKTILQNCYGEYFQIRSKLLQPLIRSQLNELNTSDSGSSLVKYIQDNLLFYSQLCQNEYDLITQFFPHAEGKEDFNKWLFRLCEPLHDRVRERVLRENEVMVLCDSVTLLSKFYQFEEDSKEYQDQFSNVQLDKVFEPLLQDVQYRLIFRAQMYVETNIVNFKPTKDAFIINHRKPSFTIVENSNDIVGSFLKSISDFEGEVEEMRSCYPPVLRAVALLSRIYQMVNSSIFDNLAHHIVHDCIESLRSAFQLVQQSEDTLESRLAYLKNLLMLRKQVQAFEIQYVCNEKYVDFSGLTEFLKSLASGGIRAASSTSVFDLTVEGGPLVVRDMVDARSELTLELRNAVKGLTTAVVKNVLGDCIDSHDDLLAKNVQLRANIEAILPRVHERMCHFVKDVEIRFHLIDAIQESLVRSYAAFYDTVAEEAADGKVSMDDFSELVYVDVLVDLINNLASSLENDNA
ncbi:LAME_0C06436g1_1 [Lachancea meyersii CBS 8951]|uniref:Conserved oligomeric Golgi complex subunit 3 n=1 Tax=Lachancea meyersii CBS 8951 TaxID=1266667 RepID=A0A1G4J255_9SACH|nr:LAME_0C06436g1_1 [Lachancea meyersii CBS 8951]